MKFLSFMTTTTIAVLIVASPAEARKYHRDLSSPVSDTLLPSERIVSGANEAFQTDSVAPRKGKRAVRRHRGKQAPTHADKTPQQASRGFQVITAKSGARTTVSTAAYSHFVCLLDKLEATGYQIDEIGGRAGRGNASAHPTGNALDVNQKRRNVVTRALPAGASEMARSCGLFHGAEWRGTPDKGHFEMANHYGYVGGGRRRYASRYRHYASYHKQYADRLPQEPNYYASARW